MCLTVHVARTSELLSKTSTIKENHDCPRLLCSFDRQEAHDEIGRFQGSYCILSKRSLFLPSNFPDVLLARRHKKSLQHTYGLHTFASIPRLAGPPCTIACTYQKYGNNIVISRCTKRLSECLASLSQRAASASHTPIQSQPCNPLPSTTQARCPTSSLLSSNASSCSSVQTTTRSILPSFRPPSPNSDCSVILRIKSVIGAVNRQQDVNSSPA